MIAKLSIPFAILLSLAGSPALAQSAETQDIRQEIAALREAQQAIARDVEAIRTMLQQAMGPRPAPAGQGAAPGAVPVGEGAQALTIKGRPSKGNPRAKVTLVEYSDYECPFCGQYVTEVAGQIESEYIKTNKINYVFKNYPIAQLHPASLKAHVAAACAGDQSRYWEMHDKLFADQRNHNLERYMEHAVALKIDPIAFRNCIESTQHEAMIREDIAEAESGGVRGTPVFVLAITDPKGQAITPARVIVGAQPFAAFKEAIDAMLAQAGTGSR